MTLKSKMRTGLVAGAGLAVMLGASMVTAADYTLKLNHVAGANTPVQVCSEVMEGYMERMSDNRFDVQVYPAAQLGNFRQSVESVQLGSLELTFTTGGGIANLFGPIQAFDIPYLLKNDRVVNRVMEDAELNKMLGDDILSALKTVRMVGMTGNHGWRSFFIDKGPTVNLPQDWQGKKIRTIESPISMELARAVGLSPTPIPWQELYTSLATGIVSGTKNSLMDIISMDFQQYLKYLFRDQHTYIMFFWWMNDPFLQGLPPELQTIFADGMDRLKAVCTGHFEVYTLPFYKQFAEAGGEIYVPTAEQKKFLLKGQVAVEKWFTDQFGTKYPTAIRAAVARAEEAIAADDMRVLGHKAMR
jgi:TRAP-type C4-dicarboxylate transport system substrate-binding protein